MTAWLRDLRYASRALRVNPAFALAALTTMTVAIAAATAVFSVVNAVLLRPMPMPAPDDVVVLGTTTRDAPALLRTASLEEIEDWQRQSRTIAAFGAWRDWGMLRYDGTRREPVFGIVATPGLFDVLRLQPALGRLLTPADDVRGASGVAVLSDDYWRQRFGGDPTVLGRQLVLERGPKASYTIVGVLPPAFNGIPSFSRVLVVLPSSADPDARTGRAHRNRLVFGRLRDGVSIAAARSDMTTVAARMASQYPDTNADRLAAVLPAIDAEVGATGDTIRAFLAAVTLVLLIAAVNVAGLQLARAVARQREFSIRRALGGTRAALVRTLVAETFLLAAVAGAAGLVLARWLVELLLLRGPALPRAATVPFDASVFLFTVLLCTASSLILALPAAMLSTRIAVARALKEQAVQVARSAVRARTIFVAAQSALALMLLVGAAAAGRALAHQLALRPGFEPEGLAWITVSPPMLRYPKADQIAALYDRVIDAARAVPGVMAASAVSAMPLSGEGAEPMEFTIEGRPFPTRGRPSANTFNVASGYFRALGPGVIRGRDFSASDGPASPRVGIVNDAFVRRYLQGADPLTVTIRIGDGSDPVHLVGIAPDVLQDLTPRAASQPEIYLPYSQAARWATFLVVRTDRSPALVLAAVRDRVASVDGEIRSGTPVVVADRIQRSSRGPRFVTILFGWFAGMAVLLSATGVGGLVVYTAAQRRREIAVRMTLGASGRDVLRLVGTGAFSAVLAGAGAGLAGAVALSRELASLLPDLEPVGPGLALSAAVVFVAVGAAACYFPARSAAAADPAAVMRG